MTAASTVASTHGIVRYLRRRGIRRTFALSREHLRARWQLRRATSVGLARVWGRVHISNAGELRIGDRARLDGRAMRIDLAADAGALLTIGDGTYINYGTNIGARQHVAIGRDCAIGQFTIIMDSDYHDVAEHWQLGPSAPVVIGDNVWLGARVTVLKGSRIGDGCVIGANSVVTGELPAYTLAAGSPARPIRRLPNAHG